MGSSYQSILAVGELANVRSAVAASGQQAVIIPVADGRWAVLPERENDIYAETEDLAELLSLAEGSLAVSFNVFDSIVMTARLFRGGECHHEYLSDQTFLTEVWDDDDNEMWFDMLGREYPPGATPSPGAYGADPGAFAALGVAPVDEEALGAVLNHPRLRAEERHHDMLDALNLGCCSALSMRYQDAVASGLGV